jgi:hypothetical protein
MRTRDDILRLSEDMGTSGTLIYNIDYSDPISELLLYVAATNGASHNKENPIEWCLQSIDVVDGSDVLFSLPGDVALAMYMHLHNKETYAYRTEAPSDSPYMTIPIAFGRYLYDPLFAFNPLAHKNPQLRITFDEATIRAAGATGYVSDSFNLTIQALLMEDAPAPRGFLMCKDVYDFTSVASGDERVDMPTDYPWRCLAVRVYEAENDLLGGITNYELNCDGGRYIMFDKSAGQVAAKMIDVFKPLAVDLTGIFSNAAYTESFVGMDKQGSFVTSGSGYIGSVTTFWPASIRTFITTHDGTATDNATCRAVVSGWAIHNTLLIPFGRLDVVEEWFNAAAYNNVRLYLTQGNADAEVNVCLQQMRPY